MVKTHRNTYLYIYIYMHIAYIQREGERERGRERQAHLHWCAASGPDPPPRVPMNWVPNMYIHDMPTTPQVKLLDLRLLPITFRRLPCNRCIWQSTPML